MSAAKQRLTSPSPFYNNTGPIAVAHRGGDGAGAGKENTLAAFRAAWDAGYQYCETDVILSADRQVVAIHGATNLWDSILRGRHSRRRLQRLTLDEIRKKFDAGGEMIPTLEEVLLSQKNMKFFVDSKTEEALEPLYRLVERLDVFDRVCVGSFNYERVKRFQRLAGARPVHSSFIIGRAFRLVNNNLVRLKAGRLKGIETVQMHHSLVSRPMLDLVHKQGLRAIIWTCNSEIAIRNALRCGADGIASDNLRLLKDILNSKPSRNL